jgi:hypothetical protein
MRKAVLALTAIIVIIFLMQPLAQRGVVEAQYPSGPTIGIVYPVSYRGEIYQTTSVPIKVSVTTFEWVTGKKAVVNMYYSLDGGPNVSLSVNRIKDSTSYNGTGTLDKLTDGYHTVKVFSIDTQGEALSASTVFLVNSTFRYPTILLSPMNITYYSKDIPLTYTIDSSKYKVFYQLDNLHTIQLTGNTTLSGLSEGQTTIKITASDENGLYSKQSASFTIDTINPTPTPTLIPTPTIPEFSWLMMLPLFLSLLSIAILIGKRKVSDSHD